MSLSFSSIDTGLNTLAGRNYTSKQEKLLASLTTTDTPQQDDDTSTAPEITKANNADISLNRTAMSLVEALGLQEASAPVEIIINMNAESKSEFSVTIKPIAINITNDCVTILMDSNVSIKPPALQPLIVKTNEILYSVVYAGSVLQTPKLNVLSFIRTESSI